LDKAGIGNGRFEAREGTRDRDGRTTHALADTCNVAGRGTGSDHDDGGGA